MKKRLKFPWGSRKNEPAMSAFRRLASESTKKDQQSLVARGWAPFEAAVEAWETATCTQ